ncbi:glycoside hydrolase [Aspergillus ambiguus]|uniref:lytic polysaccharide monooxygenase auxiliary activity family 9 protein n=1 Tax=Aspergillus ambiguus TaxID=176160 RepID=UPI003CCCF1F3
MSLSKIATGILASASLVAGHGYVSGIIADGKYYTGYLVDKYSYMDSPPDTIGWSTTATDLGFVDGTGYDSPDIICHKGGAPGALTAPVTAGSKIQLEWTTWPESHHGPLINYLAPCNGDCSQVDKTTLEFFKIEAEGLIDGSSPPGEWASDDMIANNNTAVTTIPASIANGNYVLRHELIALHSAGNLDGAQNYVQCINIEVTGGGSASPDGTLGTALYKDTDPGIKFDIYSDLSDGYPMPGPALFDA